MARPISQDKRDAIQHDLRARWGTIGLRVFAEAHSVSASTIRKVAGEIGLTSADAHVHVQNATQARRGTFAQQRAALAQRMLDEANAALDEIALGSVVTGLSWGEVVCKRVSLTTASDRRQLLTTAAIATDKHAVLDRYDSDADSTDVAKFLLALGGALDTRRETSLGSDA